MRNDSWLGRRVVVDVVHPATVSDWPGHVEGVVVEDAGEYVKVKGRILSRWHGRKFCHLIARAEEGSE